MIKRFIILTVPVAVFLNLTTVSAQESIISLSRESKVTLLTCSPGNELYSVFGHSAIRVTDPLLNLDTVFNYGTFDFDDPNFYMNFIRGKLNYKLDASSYRNFEYSYVIEDRSIYEQELNLTYEQKQYLFDSLVINYQPENQYYLYDFFFDNCATRIRDIFNEAIDSEIVFDYASLEPGKTFRDLLMPYLAEKPWARLGINLVLGLPADKKATGWDYMFLPDHMMTVFGDAQIEQENGIIEFTRENETLLNGSGVKKTSFPHLPFWVFLMVLLISIILSHLDLQSKKFSWWYDTILFGITGLLGLVIAFMWFGTDHHVTAWNLNIIWANPFHLVIIFFFSVRKNLKLLKYYFMTNLALLILLIFTWPLLPQPLPWMVMPLVMAMIVRSAVILRMFKPDILAITTGAGKK